MNKKSLIAGLILIIVIIAMFIGYYQKNRFGKFVQISDMNIARSGHKMFLLSDGKVLVYGGNAEYSPDKYDLRKYDPNKKQGLCSSLS